MKSQPNNPPTDPRNPQCFKADQSSSKKKILSSRSKGKIANLPKEQRDAINRMLDDGATYKFVAGQMAKQGVSLNIENISNWFNGAYQDHLRQLEWRAELRSLRE